MVEPVVMPLLDEPVLGVVVAEGDDVDGVDVDGAVVDGVVED